MRAITLAAVLVSALVLGQSCNSRKASPMEEPAEKKDTVYPLGFCTDSFYCAHGAVKNGEVFATMLRRLGMDQGGAMELAAAGDSVFDMRKLRSGNAIHAYYTCGPDTLGELKYLIYDNNRVDMTIFRCTEPYGVWTASRQVDTLRRFADVTIHSSLWNDMKAADAPVQLILDLSDIYAWTVDFFGLQDGDRFRVIYDERVCEGEIIDISAIHYSLFSRGEKDIPAIRLDTGDGGNLYWAPDGESLRKAFLKAPLQFKRISSGFSYHRKHPVHGTVRPHTAVDYAAPTGTPVMSIGDGTVISKGWAGGGGNTVKIRHNSVYTTSYMHLSKYASGLKVGQRVSQGQVIGYVGMTGTATGPHLDFRVWKNGTPINPLTMESPAADPISPEYLPRLDSLGKAFASVVDSLSAPGKPVDQENNQNTQI